MFHISTDKKIDGQNNISTFETIREQIDFHMTHISPILRLEIVEYIYPKLSEATVYNYSKQAVLRASDYIETTYHAVRTFMQLTQCYVCIRHFDDV